MFILRKSLFLVTFLNLSLFMATFPLNPGLLYLLHRPVYKCTSCVLVFSHFGLVLHAVGHGESEGERVHVENVDIYVQDVIHHVEQMKKEHPNLPCILLGHSMASLCMCPNHCL